MQVYCYSTQCPIVGCTPFEVFYGRVSNSELHPVLSTVTSDFCESDDGESSISVSPAYIISCITKIK